ncbi:MAG: zf-HC2 domain-containing protein [Blastocatellales bacterium]|nr:zf-HC2 domain-containing protein [Blastocatellales bacterium]
MPEHNSLTAVQDCPDPGISRMLTAYCFGRATRAEREAVETHLLECRICWSETQRLLGAIHILETDPSIPGTLTPSDLAHTFGISGRLARAFGGHMMHVLLCSGIYAALYGVAVLVEVAYQFDKYGDTGMVMAAVAFVWIFLTTPAGLWTDWRLTREGSSKGWAASAGILLGAAAALFAIVSPYLPSGPVTELNWQAYTAQAAYLKAISYFMILQSIFLLPPFHFVLAMQRELKEGRHRLALGLLTGDKLSVAPRGSIYPRFWVLSMLIFITAGISVFLHHNLMGNLRPSPYMNLFANLVQARLILYFLLATVCLVWYYRMLNELKRECLMAESPRIANRSSERR